MRKQLKKLLEQLSCNQEVKDTLKEICNLDIEQLSPRGQAGVYDVEVNHNRCWAKDLYEKNKNNLKTVALFYRGTKITYDELFKNVLKYAQAFEEKGIVEGSDMEIPMCVSYCPEFVYSLLALNLLKVKVNIFGEFDKDYLVEIINDCNSDFIVCTDDQYSHIKDVLDEANVSNIVMFSLADSLIGGKDPYIELDKDFYDFENKVSTYKKLDSRISSTEEFLLPTHGKSVKTMDDYASGSLNDEFLVTYSSGSTNSKRPKAIVHSNRSLVTIGRFQDPDLSGLPEMKDLVGEALIPTHSNTGLISSLSDVLYKGCTVALEPIYNKNFFLISMAINKPNYVCAPRNMIVHGAKQIYSDERFKNFKMPYMMMLTSVGEPTSMGEEKFINKMMRKAKCGVAKLPRPIAPVPLSIGGGDCERGGMFFTPYRKLQDLYLKYSLVSGARCGLIKYDMVELAVLDDFGNKLPNGSVGHLVANTPTVMRRYKNNEKATAEFFIRDASGKLWTNCNTYARIEEHGTVEILERVGKELVLDDGTILPLFYIGKEVEKDTKHILSYEVVNVDNNIVVHIEFQPGVSCNIGKVLLGIENRISRMYGLEVTKKIVYKIRSFEEEFPSTACEKRSYQALLDEGIDERCIKVFPTSDGIQIVSAQEYLNITKNDKCKALVR